MKSRITGFFFLFVGFIVIVFLAFLYLAIAKPSNYFNPVIKIKQSAIRGEIKTDKYVIAKSEKLYGVYIYPAFIDPDKKELFYTLFSIYTDIPKVKLKKIVLYGKRKGLKRIRIATVDLKTKQNLIYLRKVLDKKRVFVADKKTGIRRGYEIESLDFKRVYPYNDTLQPYLGRFRKDILSGDNGLEYYYNDLLSKKRDGYKIGYRDVYGNIIYDKSAKIARAVNGDTINLNINLVLQRKIEKLLSAQKDKYQAKEVLALVMKSDTGEIVAIASSNRYNPNHVTSKDIPNMKISAIREMFEPGSVMKPITFAILLEHNKVNPYEMIYANNGRWKPEWRKTPIRDDEPFKMLSAEDAIVHSSNIVLSKLSLRLSAKEFYEGLRKFGFSKKTDIDLPFELKGKIRSQKLLNYPIFKSTTAYGYGILVTFVQLAKAYNAFNNNGIEITPRIAKTPGFSKRVMSAKNAQIMLGILRKVVEKGTGKAALVDGIFTAGKTGTAHVSVRGKGYKNIYNSSFIGFANDRTHKYTIAVTFFDIKAKWPYYFASQSAVPTFKKIVDIMLTENLLKADNAE
jgi:cell division protein FtsI (penicillin-binding protein 3)